MCDVCNSPMVERDGMWQCDSCHNVLTTADMPLDIMIDEGVMLDDVLPEPGKPHGE